MSTVRHRDRAALGAQLRFSAVAVATAWAAMWSWRGFTLQSGTFLINLVLIGAVVAGTGALARWRRLPGVVVVLAQVVVGGAVTCQVVAQRPYPGPAFWAMLGDAVDAANTYAAPVPQTELVSVQPLLVVGGLVAMLLVDLCAATLRRVPLAGLPLLTVYSVPVSLIDRGLSWWVFAGTAIGFLLLLFLQEEEHLSRWGRALDGSTSPGRRLSDSVRASALVIGSVATAAAIVVPLAIPTLSFSVFDVGPGNGGDGDIEVTNPLVDLRQDLIQGPDDPLITIRTDDPSPDHLRISVLNRYTSDQWSAGDRDVPTANLAQGEVPLLDEGDPGIVTYEQADYEVEIEDSFVSRWLPTQAPITEITADGDWRFDESTMDFLASDDDLDTAGERYRMTAALPTYDEPKLLRLNTMPTVVDDELTDLPDDLPASIGRLARAETASASTDFERAVLLNQFFRNPRNFTYDIASQSGRSVGTGELTDFLDASSPTGRVGYCEQFAAAMGVMARTLDIPARVAVGFLNPDRVAAGTFVYSAHDLHAWVELYFPDAGWVLFDPTPAITDGFQPDYASARVEGQELPTGTQAPEETRPTTAAPTRPEQEVPTTAPQPEPAGPANSDDGSSFPWLVVLAVLGVLVLLALLSRLPRTLRARQRERRLGGGPESAWDELRATALDLGLAWPEGRSPHETRAVVVGWFGRVGDGDQRPARGPDQAPEAVAAIDRVVGHLERLRYSRRHAVDPGSLRDDVLLCCDALAAGAPPRVRRRATWLPVTVTQRRRVSDHEAAPADGEPELVGGRSEVL